MAEEKRSSYTGQTEARRRASAKYLKETVEDIRIRVPKGQKAIIKSHAENQGESMNAFVVRAITKQWNVIPARPPTSSRQQADMPLWLCICPVEAFNHIEPYILALIE